MFETGIGVCGDAGWEEGLPAGEGEAGPCMVEWVTRTAFWLLILASPSTEVHKGACAEVPQARRLLFLVTTRYIRLDISAHLR